MIKMKLILLLGGMGFVGFISMGNAIAQTSAGAQSQALKGEPLEVMVSRTLKSSTSSKLRMQGVGFFVDWDGHLLTASHVILGCKSYEITNKKGEKVDAVLIGADSSIDLAILRADITHSDPFEIQPYSFNRPQEFNAVAPERSGELSQVTRVTSFGEIMLPRRNVLRITPALAVGNSGGPIYDNFGDVVAMVVGKWGQIGAEESIAIPGELMVGFLAYHRIKRTSSKKSKRSIPDWYKIRESVVTVTCKLE